MSKINIPMENVVIGSNTIEEHKMQVLNFMNMLYNIAFNNADKCNINPWIDNLKYEISWLRRKKYYNTYAFKIETHIEILRKKMINKSVTKNDWKSLLIVLTSLFELKYTLN
jgi:hypothetical protein